jgi:N-acyl homoserine lactone hydrolase
VVQGFPGKSVCHGGLGWCSVVLLRAHRRLALIDTGNKSMRTMLIQRFAERGLKPADITELLLTHSYHDHSANWTMFAEARIVIGADELAWSLAVPWGETPVPGLYMRELNVWPTAHEATEGDVIFAGDAAKNRAELVSGITNMTYDAPVSKASIDAIWAMWRKRPGNIVVPGHDVRWCWRTARRNISASAKPRSAPGSATTWKPRHCSS